MVRQLWSLEPGAWSLMHLVRRERERGALCAEVIGKSSRSVT